MAQSQSEEEGKTGPGSMASHDLTVDMPSAEATLLDNSNHAHRVGDLHSGLKLESIVESSPGAKTEESECPDIE